jgi:hypothetical protein
MGVVREEEYISSSTAQHIQDKCQGGSRVAGETRFERLENTFKGTSAFNQALHSGMDLFASRLTLQLNMS